MKGVTFYRVFQQHGHWRKPKDDVVAVFTDRQNPTGDYDCMVAVQDTQEGQVKVEMTTASSHYLSWFAEQISEAEARAIHPCLFERLDEE
jgi:hypothetical protein